jgi:hypothetical protein
MDHTKSATAVLRVCSAVRTAAELAALLPIGPSRLVGPAASLRPLVDRDTPGDARWLIDSTLSEAEPIVAHIESLIKLIDQHRTAFDVLPPDCEMDIWCTVTSAEEFTGFALSRELLNRIASLNIGLVLSCYLDSVPEATVAEGSKSR